MYNVQYNIHTNLHALLHTVSQFEPNLSQLKTNAEQDLERDEYLAKTIYLNLSLFFRYIGKNLKILTFMNSFCVYHILRFHTITNQV